MIYLYKKMYKMNLVYYLLSASVNSRNQSQKWIDLYFDTHES